MRGDTPKDGNNPEHLAEMRVTNDATATRDGSASESAPDFPVGADDAADALGEMSDSLLLAYHFAKLDGDPTTVALIEKVLLHVGRRLARGLSPADVGIACH